MLGGVFNTFPYPAYAQNVGLVAMTRVRSRWVVAMGVPPVGVPTIYEKF